MKNTAYITISQQSLRFDCELSTVIHIFKKQKHAQDYYYLHIIAA